MTTADSSEPGVSAPGNQAEQPWIRLRRMPCDEPCAEYEVTVYSDGRVRWVGHRFVGTIGEAWKTVDGQAVADLIARLTKLNWENKPTELHEHDCGTDYSSSRLTLHRPEGALTWLNYHGCEDKEHLEMRVFDREVDELTKTQAWIESGVKCSREGIGSISYANGSSHPTEGDSPPDEWRRQFFEKAVDKLKSKRSLRLQLRSFDGPGTAGIGKVRVEAFRDKLIEEGVPASQIFTLVIELPERGVSGELDNSVATVLDSTKCTRVN